MVLFVKDVLVIICFCKVRSGNGSCCIVPHTTKPIQHVLFYWQNGVSSFGRRQFPSPKLISKNKEIT